MILSFLKKLGIPRLVLIIFVLLALFILIVEKPGRGSLDKAPQNQPLLFPRLRLEDVTHMAIAGGPQKLTLAFQKTGEGWTLNEAPVPPGPVEAWIKTIYELKKEGLVSQNPEKQVLFQVDEVSGLEVALWKNSKILAHFYAGKTTGLGSQYVRLEGENEVWEASPLLPPLNFGSNE